MRPVVTLLHPESSKPCLHCSSRLLEDSGCTQVKEELEGHEASMQPILRDKEDLQKDSDDL
jgi:hypothetical protein